LIDQLRLLHGAHQGDALVIMSMAWWRRKLSVVLASVLCAVIILSGSVNAHAVSKKELKIRLQVAEKYFKDRYKKYEKHIKKPN
jgi:hypothetical protein